MLKLFRTNTWWNAVVPQVLGWLYLSMRMIDWPPIRMRDVIFFFVALVSISMFGYLFNDLCDVKSDKKAGKKNALGKFPFLVRLVIVALPLMIGVVFWHEMLANTTANILFSLQILTLVFYSLPPIRLKERGVAGVIADAFYGHINPVLITLFAFLFDKTKVVNLELVVFLSIVLVCLTLKGIRNILLHQLDDRKNDLRAGIQTFVVKNGAYPTLLFVNNLLPFEVFFTILLALIFGYVYPPFFVWTLVFFIITYFKFSGWKLRDLPKRQLKFKFLYFLNDYYEGWVPVFFLIMLCISQPQLSFLLILHLILFPGFITKLWGDIKTIRENFKTEDDY